MKLLFDQNLSFSLCASLADLFPGSAQVRGIGLERADDRVIWQHAKQNGFVLVSLDSDFTEFVALYGPPPRLVWLRCGNQPISVIEKLLRRHAAAIAQLENDDAPACLEIFASESY